MIVALVEEWKQIPRWNEVAASQQASAQDFPQLSSLVINISPSGGFIWDKMRSELQVASDQIKLNKTALQR